VIFSIAYSFSPSFTLPVSRRRSLTFQSDTCRIEIASCSAAGTYSDTLYVPLVACSFGTRSTYSVRAAVRRLVCG
jgi:hypothetical protein